MKKKFRIQFQGTKSIKSKEHSGESSPYWDYQGRQDEDLENPLANPDSLETGVASLLWGNVSPTEEETDILNELRGFDFSSILSHEELEVLKLLVISNKQIPEIQNHIGYKESKIKRILKSCGDKIRRHLKID